MTRYAAPGKLVLVGEYAVLLGAPAIVAAVDHGVCCTVTPADTLSWSTPGDDRFVAAALERSGAPAAHYAFEACSPVPVEEKVGFGHSASATAVALYAAGLRGEALLRTALAVHLEVQGNGSGVDVAAACTGGVVAFDGTSVARMAPVTPVVVYSGAAARTGPRVARFLDWAGREPSEARRFAQASAELVERWSAAPREVLRTGRELLDAMTRSAGIEYWTPALVQLCDLAEDAGGAAKPSGAGGGDSIVALFPDEESRATFERACGEAGYPTIPVQVSEGPGEIA